MKIAGRVYQVAGGDLTAPEDAAAYVVDGGTEFALIDTGAGDTVHKILENLREFGFLTRKAAFIVATHAHIDHIGGLALLKEQLNCPVVAHHLDCDAIETGDSRRTAASFYRKKCPPCMVDVVMEGEALNLAVGELVLHLIHTPGHTPGSICAWVKEEETILFAQDLHGPFHADWGSDRNLWRASLQQLLTLNADILCEGHFGIFSGAVAVKGYIQSWLYR
jgi:glyoxylase-like metal-dependent hydrolase (beta-lactamase superfamily II)